MRNELLNQTEKLLLNYCPNTEEQKTEAINYRQL